MNALRTERTRAEIGEWFELSLIELLLEAQQVHRRWHATSEASLATLLSIKTGLAPRIAAIAANALALAPGPAWRQAS